MRTFSKLLIGAVLLICLVFGGNWLSVGGPVSSALDEDARNSGLEISARHAYYVMPSTLVLDLHSADAASPADLGRAFFQAAATLEERSFARIVFAHRRGFVFQMEGDDFQKIGRQFASGENPMYLIRKLPSKLYERDGTSAYGSWSGGLLGVFGKEMEDYNDAMTRWATGQE